MTLSPRLERALQRAAESAGRVAEQKLRIVTLRANGTTAAAKILNELKIAHRLFVEQLAMEQAKSLR
jgi:Mn-dependent DtxR family transcriptional regulator